MVKKDSIVCTQYQCYQNIPPPWRLFDLEQQPQNFLKDFTNVKKAELTLFEGLNMLCSATLLYNYNLAEYYYYLTTLEKSDP